MLISVMLLIIGFTLLIKGADFLVTGAAALAKRLKISDLAIGLTIVAFGTSLPELIVNITASFQGNADIAIGNILGSNIANILLIFGICAVIRPLRVTHGTIWNEIPMALLAALMVGIMGNDYFFDGVRKSMLSRSEGLILILFFIVFLFYIYHLAKAAPPVEHKREKNMSLWLSLLTVAAGLGLLVIGGKWVVDSAVILAAALGASQALIGLTIVAVGTSLPELATSAVAAFKGESNIAIGNIVGSNIFNIFWVLGLSAAIRPLPFTLSANADIAMVIFASLILFLAMFVGKKMFLERWQGGAMIAIYVGYVIFLIFRG